MVRSVVLGLVCVASVASARDAFFSSSRRREVAQPSRGIVTATEPRLGVPTFYWAEPLTRAHSPRAQGLTAAEAARTHLLEVAALYRLDASRVAAASLHAVHDAGQGAVIVTFQQRVNGVPLVRDELHVVMNRELEVVAISGYLTPEVQPLGDFRLSAASAASTAWELSTGVLRSIDDASARDDAGFETWSLPDGFLRARPVYFPLDDGAAAAFHVEVEWRGGLRAVLLSAVDGAVLSEKNLVAEHTYAVWADPTTKLPSPNPWGWSSLPSSPGNALPVVPQTVMTLDHAGLSTADPWLSPGATQTVGNNVYAYTDFNAPDGYTAGLDQYGLATAPGEFRPVFSPTIAAISNDAQRQVGVVHMFYVLNFLHDWLYDAGFNERSGNGQQANFQRGGVGADPLHAQSIDGSGFNNANMATPADGRSARMQMYVWNSATPTRDSALDTTVVAHEYGHFVTNRLIGNALGLSNNQGYGLGEGWADMHAALLAVEASDVLEPGNANWAGAYAVAAYAANEPTFGIRRFPLSQNLAVNPLTFRHIDGLVGRPTGAPINDNYAPNYEVHNTGEVWTAMLWDCFVKLLTDPRHSFEAARERMKRYLIASYKATPVTPHFVEARDALLAVVAAQDDQDYLRFWEAFARRGIGAGAIAPDRYDWANRRVTENYAVQKSLRITALTLEESSSSCDHDGVVDAEEDGVVKVTVLNVSTSTLGLHEARLTLSATSAALTFPDGASITVPSLAPSESKTIAVRARLERLLGPHPVELTATVAGLSLFPPSSSARESLLLNYDARHAVSRTDDFEVASMVWSAGANPQLDITPGFRRLQVTPTQHFWFAPPGAQAADVWLVTPPLEVGEAPFVLTMQHRYEFEREGDTLYDGAVIELSTDDGATWADVASRIAGVRYTGALQTQFGNPLAGRRAFAGRSEQFPAFAPATFDFGTDLAGRTVRLRFRVASDDVQRQASRGWEIDDVRISGLVNTPFPELSLDPNRCTNSAPVVSAPATLTLREGQRVTLEGMGTDADGDALTLTWVQRSGLHGVLTGAIFVAPEVTRDETLTLELRAHDGRTTSAPAVTKVTVTQVNRPPRVTMPAGQLVKPGQRVEVTASASDFDGDALTYQWTQQSGPPVTLTGDDTTRLRFTAPSTQQGDALVFSFVAFDGRDLSMPGTVTIRLEPPVPTMPLPMEAPPQGCGCTGGGGAVTALLALLLRRRFRSTVGRS